MPEHDQYLCGRIEEYETETKGHGVRAWELGVRCGHLCLARWCAVVEFGDGWEL